MLETPASEDIIALALAEDLGVPPEAFAPGAPPFEGLLEHDATSAAVVSADARFKGRVVAREAGVVCGLALLERVYETLARAAGAPGAAEVYPLVAEGADVVAAQAVAEVEGPARLVLAGERTALNLLMTLSGIATEARRWQTAAGPGLAVVDTRKTLPGLRALSKHAVLVGGAHNHRTGLHDMVLIKDNHLRRAGGVAQAVAAAKAGRPDLLVECEAETVEQALEAARAGADMVLLDNMDDTMLTLAVAAVREATASDGREVLTEASGGVRFDRLEALAGTGVDRVSSSAITLAPPLDLGLDEDAG